ncbi:putative transcription factor interactor and regulator CCHC(Zn) family [Helianthus annuus]|nr:putative transcription factor interactor and regulator CCHC(Zn) family [Helianthus annuus]
MKKIVAQKKTETRTCFQCKTVGHIARNCPKAIQIKQGVSGKLKEKVVEKTKLTTKKFTGFENSKFEVGECSRNVLKGKENLKNQKWVVKGSGSSSSDESDLSKSEELSTGDESVSTKTEEPHVVVVVVSALHLLIASRCLGSGLMSYCIA